MNAWRMAAVVGVLAAALLMAAPARADEPFPDVCKDDPHNLTANCKFNNGFSGWHTFLEAGSAPTVTVENSYPACDSPDCPAVRLYAEEWFVGGIYQRVSGLTPGRLYWGNVIWLVYDPAGNEYEAVANLDVVGRSVGIDPYGGTDPTSPNVVWGEQYWKSFTTCPYKICRELQVEAMARSTTITLFVRIEDTWKTRPEDFPAWVPSYFFTMDERYWIDDVGLIDSGALGVVTTTVTSAGGSLLSNDPEQSVLVEFPAHAVAAPTVVTYTYVPPLATGELAGMDRFFHITAASVTHFARPVTVTVTFPARSVVKAGSEGLYWLDGDDWVSSGITSSARTSSTLVSLTDHFSFFGVLGETERVFLPLVIK